MMLHHKSAQCRSTAKKTRKMAKRQPDFSSQSQSPIFGCIFGSLKLKESGFKGFLRPIVKFVSGCKKIEFRLVKRVVDCAKECGLWICARARMRDDVVGVSAVDNREQLQRPANIGQGRATESGTVRLPRMLYFRNASRRTSIMASQKRTDEQLTYDDICSCPVSAKAVRSTGVLWGMPTLSQVSQLRDNIMELQEKKRETRTSRLRRPFANLRKERLLVFDIRANKSIIGESKFLAHQLIVQRLRAHQARKKRKRKIGKYRSKCQSKRKSSVNSGETQWQCTKPIVSHVVAVLSGHFSYWDEEDIMPQLTSPARLRLTLSNALPTGLKSLKDMVGVIDNLLKTRSVTIRLQKKIHSKYFSENIDEFDVATRQSVNVQCVTLYMLSRVKMPWGTDRFDKCQSRLLEKYLLYLAFCTTQVFEKCEIASKKRKCVPLNDTANVVPIKKDGNVHSSPLCYGTCSDYSGIDAHGHHDKTPIEVSDEENTLEYVKRTDHVHPKNLDMDDTSSKAAHGTCTGYIVDDHDCETELHKFGRRALTSKEKDDTILSKSVYDLMLYVLELNSKRLLTNRRSANVAAYPVHVVYHCSPLRHLASASHECRSHLDIFRLASFRNWRHLGKQSALRCSSAGFSVAATGDISSAGDDLACFTCGCSVSGWAPGVDPVVLHYDKCGQHCPFAAMLPTRRAVSEGVANTVFCVTEYLADMTNLTAVYPSVSPAISNRVEQPSVTECLSFFGLSPFTVKSATTIDSYRPAAMAVAASSSVMVKRLTAGCGPTAMHRGESSVPLTKDDLAKHESYRLSTFENVWTYNHIVHARELSRNGFLYAGPGDRVQCAFCQGLLRNWEPGDRADEMHAQHFTYCRFVQGHDVGNVPIPFWPLTAKFANDAQSSADATGGAGPDLGINCSVPSHPDLAVEARRLLTFATWPANHHMTPEMLAKSGFFYLGNEDAVQCFFCDCVVTDWKTPCDPWVEHAQRCPECSFVKQVQGYEFVRRHCAEDGQASRGTNTMTSLAVDPREVRARMDSHTIRIVLRMDYPLDLVREVVQKRLATVGRDHETSEQLLDDVFQTHDKKQRANTAGCVATPAIQPVFVSHQRLEADRQDRTASRSTTMASTVTVAVAASASSGAESRGVLAGNVSLLTGERASLVATLRSDEENRQLKTQLTCKVCMDKLVGIVFLPCGHLVCCPECAPAMKSCPICRVSIRGTVRTMI